MHFYVPIKMLDILHGSIRSILKNYNFNPILIILFNFVDIMTPINWTREI